MWKLNKMLQVSGVMTAVCLFELLPTAKDTAHWERWLCLGMALACCPSLIFE